MIQDISLSFQESPVKINKQEDSYEGKEIYRERDRENNQRKRSVFVPEEVA